MTKDRADFQEIMRTAGAFRESMILFTAVELDLFSSIGEESQNGQTLSHCLGCDGQALVILMDALVAMGYLIKTGLNYANTEKSRIFLTRNSPNYRGAILRHLHDCWSLWGDLTETVKRGKPAEEANSFLFSDHRKNRDYIWGMDNVGQDRAIAIRAVLDLSDKRRLLDLGCGAATYSIRFLKDFPDLESTLFDLPITLEVARSNIEKNALQDRVVYREGNFFENDFGSGYDMVWISQILHGYTVENCRELIGKSFAALEPGGWVVIHDFLVDEDRTAPYFAVLFAAHMLAATKGGRCYCGDELRRWLEDAGFTDIHIIRVDEQSTLVRGKKPE